MSSLKIVGVVAGAVLLILVVGVAMMKMAPQNADADDAVALTKQLNDLIAKEKRWTYRQDTDALRQSKEYFATVHSDNIGEASESDSSEPYLTMTVRREHNGDEVMLMVNHAQFVCPSDGCSGAISVDGHQHSLTLNRAESGSDTTLFVGQGPALTKELAGAKKIIVEVPIYQQGAVQFTIAPPEPLKWPPADKS